MSNFRMEQFKRLPIQPGAIWQGGVFPLPTWVIDENERPVRPRTTLWVDPSAPRVSKPDFLGAEDACEGALSGLIDFALEPGRKAHRPFAIEVKDGELASFLRERIGSIGTRIDQVDKLRAVDAILEDIAGRMNKRKEPAGALSGQGVTLDAFRRFAEAAALFYRKQLWDELSDEDLIEIEFPMPPKGMRFVSVLGHGGQTFGFGFFETREQFDKMYELASPGRALLRKGVWSLWFGDLTELPIADADLWEKHNLPVAGPEAYPVAIWSGPKQDTRRPDSAELQFLEGLLRGLADTTDAEMDELRWSRNVAPGAESAPYQFALVRELSEEGPLTAAGKPRIDPQYLRRAMEKGMADLTSALAGHEFESIEEANAYIQSRFRSGGMPEAIPRTALERAQQLMYQAWEAPGRRRRKLAREALKVCPDCADAFVLLAEDTSDESKACELFRLGVEAGKRALGEQVFRSEVGNFWGILETRPYMRACAGLAECLWQLGRREEAVAQYEDLLRLNPGDNQGVRYVLAACLLELGDDAKLGSLIDAHADEDSAQWCYLRALRCYRQEGDSAKARKAAKQAMKTNRYVPDYLSGRRRLPERIPEAFHFGQEDEGICCAAECKAGWKGTPGAIEWLTALGQATPP